MRSSPLRFVALAAVTFLSSGFAERSAEACSREPPKPGYILSITTSAISRDDRTSPVACQPGLGSACGPDVRYSGFRRALLVRAELDGAAGPSGSWVGDTTTIVLKDASGKVVAEQRGASPLGTAFDVLGATVCIKTGLGPEATDGGVVPSYGEVTPTSEVCAPVTVSTLEPSDADRAAFQASLDKDCAAASSDPAGTGSAAGSDAGCSVGRGASTAQAGLLVVGLALAGSLVRRRRIS